MLVSIGAWCRPGYQVKEFVRGRGSRVHGYPFDWTITSFAALRRVLDPSFDPAGALNVDKLLLTKLGSLQDPYTELIHQHDLGPKVLEGLQCDDTGFPVDLLESAALAKARDRLQHTYASLQQLRHAPGRHGFVRWMRYGHPDSALPDVFEEETPRAMYALLRRFLEHERVALLHVTTRLAPPNEGTPEPTQWIENPWGVQAVIREPSGDFRGDTATWDAILERFVKDHNISV